MATTTMSDFRVDPVSGLKIHKQANTLVKANAFAAVVAGLLPTEEARDQRRGGPQCIVPQVGQGRLLCDERSGAF